ncbi:MULTISPECIES: type VI secretion system-associated FHA domain protein TagH [unclassified Bradyrhizobium]|uniref:type VI secretion system-associated FHA domain protein TagH n=1 Tax=unclassified Bradyrhizobium TaxID=2631580 RepID=UPI002478AE52|nr:MULTISPECIES: type VI secretion system-associated FHA domain protein TagH [unclassified Bradyrhizobium]WGR72805.1 type VI secretion system-associated FHA domain protein TagH [Bradyrhizobium sp. ISRA426]WGR77640.1 type VI secretion system-associated FHA domain protein TagH [Bradyrhizobium sp. ISRA430]WGR88045.1 type VI secretion system-associated FHA domain protein TagH [Bradyrhizobium sp. ISRA432]
MHLTLGVLGENAEPLGRNARQAFGPEGGSIGRGRGCYWRLPDPTNTLSGHHALIAFNGIGFTITDTSTNGVYINTVDAPLGRGNTTPLADGDTLYLAHYTLSVMIEDDPVEERQLLGLTGSKAVRVGRTTPTLPSPAFTQKSATAAVPTAGPSVNDAYLPPEPSRVTGPRQIFYSAAQCEPQAPHPPSLPGGKPLSSDIEAVDPTLADLPRRPSSATTTQRPSSHAQSGNVGSILLSSVDTPFVKPSQPLPSAPFNGRNVLPNGHPAPIIPEDLDLGDLLPGPVSCCTPSVSSQRTKARLNERNELRIAPKPTASSPTNHFGKLPNSGSRTPPPDERELDRLLLRLKETAPPRVVGTPETRSSTRSGAPLLPTNPPSDTDELQAFWDALGFNPDLVPPAQRREFFAELGHAVAEMTNGLHSILAAWAMLKNECQIRPTQTRAGNDNAVQFTNSSHVLREALAKDHGFRLLSRSVRAGFDDIKAHEVAAMAAMRGAVSNVLTHMSPQRIESDGAISGLFGARINKAKLWDRFVELHASMVNDIDRTARSFVAEEFARSYETRRSESGRNEGKTA